MLVHLPAFVGRLAEVRIPQPPFRFALPNKHLMSRRSIKYRLPHRYAKFRPVDAKRCEAIFQNIGFVHSSAHL